MTDTGCVNNDTHQKHTPNKRCGGDWELLATSYLLLELSCHEMNGSAGSSYAGDALSGTGGWGAIHVVGTARFSRCIIYQCTKGVHGGPPGAVLDPDTLKHFGPGNIHPHAPRAATSRSTNAKSNLANHLIIISHKPCYGQSGRDTVA